MAEKMSTDSPSQRTDDKRETPRTDAVWEQSLSLDGNHAADLMYETCLQLERELNAAREDLDRLTRGTWSKELARLSAANASLREELNAARSAKLTTVAVLNAMQDHYWDSLEPQRDIVMKHIESVLRIFATADSGRDK